MNDIHAALQELEQAQGVYDAAATMERAARSDLTSALNALNVAQKNVDDAVDSLRRSAPRDTDWKRPTGVLLVEH